MVRFIRIAACAAALLSCVPAVRAQSPNRTSASANALSVCIGT